MRLARETACATDGKSFACKGGAGFSLGSPLGTPACGRIFSGFSRLLDRRRTCSSFALRNRTAAPGDEFPVPEAFGARPSAAGHFEQAVEDLLPDLLHGGGAIGNRAGVDIHVIRHAAEGVAIGGDLNYRDGGEPDGAAASGGEGDQVASAGGARGDRVRSLFCITYPSCPVQTGAGAEKFPPNGEFVWAGVEAGESVDLCHRSDAPGDKLLVPDIGGAEQKGTQEAEGDGSKHSAFYCNGWLGGSGRGQWGGALGRPQRTPAGKSGSAR